MPYSHYRFDISYDIDDETVEGKRAIDYLDIMLKKAMSDFGKHCRSKRIRMSNLKMTGGFIYGLRI